MLTKKNFIIFTDLALRKLEYQQELDTLLVQAVNENLFYFINIK